MFTYLPGYCTRATWKMRVHGDKDSTICNETGHEIESEVGVPHLPILCACVRACVFVHSPSA